MRVRVRVLLDSCLTASWSNSTAAVVLMVQDLTPAVPKVCLQCVSVCLHVASEVRRIKKAEDHANIALSPCNIFVHMCMLSTYLFNEYLYMKIFEHAHISIDR